MLLKKSSKITGILNKYNRFGLKCIRSTPLGHKHLLPVQGKGVPVGGDWRGECSRCRVKVSCAPRWDPDGCTTTQAVGLHQPHTPGEADIMPAHAHIQLGNAIYMSWWGVFGTVGKTVFCRCLLCQKHKRKKIEKSSACCSKTYPFDPTSKLRVMN